MSAKLHLTIDGKSVAAEAGETVLQAARRAGIEIPTLCHLEGLSPDGSCRLCVVELGNGSLAQACTLPCAEGMAVLTRSDRVTAARKWVLSLLLRRHFNTCFHCPNCFGCEKRPLSLCNYEENCFSCPGKESCRLRAYALEYGVLGEPYSIHMEDALRPVAQPNAALRYDPNHCILCRRCYRTCGEEVGAGLISLWGRGPEVALSFAAAEQRPDLCLGCGKCADACATGALTRAKA